jgi:hypothetical protein
VTPSPLAGRASWGRFDQGGSVSLFRKRPLPIGLRCPFALTTYNMARKSPAAVCYSRGRLAAVHSESE